MKPSRRHELKTNELSVFLKQVYAGAAQNLNYVIGGVVVVVAILVVGLYVQRHREKSREEAWAKFTDLQSSADQPTQALVDSARELAAAHQGSGDLGPRSAALAADAAYGLALSLDPAKESAKRLELLRDARSRYEGMIERYSDQPAVVAAARFSLAKTEESLLMAGESTKEKVLAQYQILAKDEHGAFKALADKAMKTLDERTQPLKVVASRPAEAPAAIPNTQPTATQPEAVGTQPARVPPAQPASTRSAP